MKTAKEILEDQKKICELYAHYWMAMATTGAACDRDLRHGSIDGEPFTDQEKINSAMNTALTHIQRFIECSEHDPED